MARNLFNTGNDQTTIADADKLAAGSGAANAFNITWVAFKNLIIDQVINVTSSWTPALTGSNITGLAASETGYTKTGRMVFISGGIDGNITSGASEVEISIVLPVARNASFDKFSGIAGFITGSGDNRFGSATIHSSIATTDLNKISIFIPIREINAAGAVSIEFSATYIS